MAYFLIILLIVLVLGKVAVDYFAQTIELVAAFSAPLMYICIGIGIAAGIFAIIKLIKEFKK